MPKAVARAPSSSPVLAASPTLAVVGAVTPPTACWASAWRATSVVGGVFLLLIGNA